MSSSSSSVPPPQKRTDIVVAVEESLENQVVSSASSPVPQPENRNDIVVAVEESQERAPENNNPELGLPQEVVSERRSENPSLGPGGVVPTGSEIRQMYPPRSDRIFICEFCDKEFSTCQALGGHQNAHKKEKEWEKKRKEMEDQNPGFTFFDPQLDKPHLLLGGYSEDALTNDNHLGITFESFKSRCAELYPFLNVRIDDMNLTKVPRVTPTRFFDGKTLTSGSPSGGLEPTPPYTPMLGRNVPPPSGGLEPRPPYTPMLGRNVPPPSGGLDPRPPYTPMFGPPFIFPFPPPPPPTTNFPSGLFPQENVVNEENFISMIGKDDTDDDGDDDSDSDSDGDDDLGEGPSKSWGADLCL